MKNFFKKPESDKDIQIFIGQFLRWGAFTACSVVIIGGFLFLEKHAFDPMPSFADFRGKDYAFTNFQDIWQGVLTFNSIEIIQCGIILLIFTPILRVILALFSFTIERDKLYMGITFIVLCIIFMSFFKR